ncbi:PLP-dependent aminotransferase family protein, partial [Lysinibacillus sp.]
MFNDFKVLDEGPVYVQLKKYVQDMIVKGHLLEHQKLPSTRELSKLLTVSRNTVLNAYAELEQDGIIYAVKGKGHFVGKVTTLKTSSIIEMDWKKRLNDTTLLADEIDLIRQDIHWQKGMISFISIAPEEKLFDVENFKRAFLTRMSIEGDIVLNYGYAKGYKPLIDYLLGYMEMKGVDISNKDIMITNGFTEGLDILLSSFAKKSGRVLCENPTHHAALKLFRMHGLDIHGIDMSDDGVDIGQVEQDLAEKQFDFAYFIPSYHNPTGIVTSSEKRNAIFQLFSKYQIPIVEDGFNEELRYTGSHLAPLIAFSGSGNNIVYIGSFSKILFPGLRVGWILA